MTYRIACILTLVTFILISFFIWGGYGILGSILIIFFSAPVWSSVYMNVKPLSLGQFKRNVVSFCTEGVSRVIILVILHVIIGFNLGRLTLIQDTSLIYFTLAFMGYAYAYFKKNKTNLYWYSLGLSPLLISLFLVLNYYISYSPVLETYKYRTYIPKSHSEDDEEVFIIGSRIILENRAYQEFSGIRSFLDKSGMKGGRITYTFKTGLFGVKVVSKREFNSR